MLNILESDTKDFQKIVNDILLEVKPMRLRGSITDKFLGYCNELRQKIADLEAKLAESEKEIASLEVCLLENKNNMKEMQEFKIGEDEYDLTDENARNDLRDYIQEFEKVSKRVYEQKEYAEKILRMSTSEEHQEILQLKQQLAEKEKQIATLMEAVDARDKEIEALAIVLNRECVACKPTQKAIAFLEEVKEFIIKNNEPTKKMTAITRFINQQINELKGEM